MHIGAQPRPNGGVEVREATSIHEAGGDRRRGSEVDGGMGLRRSVLGRGLGRRRVEEGGERNNNGKGGEEQRVEMGKEEKEKKKNLP